MLAKSLREVRNLKNNIKDLSSYPGFEVNINLESLLTINVENEHAVTILRREHLLSTNSTEFWLISWRSKESDTQPLLLPCWTFCYWPVGPCWNSHTGPSKIVQILWSKEESVGKTPLNLYETQTLLNSIRFCSLYFLVRKAQCRGKCDSDEQPAEVLTCTDQR